MVNPERIKVVAFETEDEIADQVPVVISKMVTSPMKTDPSEQRMSLSKD
jgi:hypothetical protein